MRSLLHDENKINPSGENKEALDDLITTERLTTLLSPYLDLTKKLASSAEDQVEENRALLDELLERMYETIDEATLRELRVQRREYRNLIHEALSCFTIPEPRVSATPPLKSGVRSSSFPPPSEERVA